MGLFFSKQSEDFQWAWSRSRTVVVPVCSWCPSHLHRDLFLLYLGGTDATEYRFSQTIIRNEKLFCLLQEKLLRSVVALKCWGNDLLCKWGSKVGGSQQNIERLYVICFEFRNKILLINAAPSPTRHRFKTAFLIKDYSVPPPPRNRTARRISLFRLKAAGRGPFIWSWCCEK